MSDDMNSDPAAWGTVAGAREFTCAWCRRLRSWDEGCSDDMPEVCDRCWCVAHGLAAETP